MVYGIIAIVIGYLLGSIPTAYLATRVAAGKDIRRLGGGNVGGLNVYREVGFLPALVVAIVDLAKGAAAVAIAQWLLDVSPPFVLAAALASVVGHNWMVWLKFSGGKGMGAAIGSLFVLLPLYGYPWGLAIFFVVNLDTLPHHPQCRPVYGRRAPGDALYCLAGHAFGAVCYLQRCHGADNTGKVYPHGYGDTG